jgi:hypothetical protein
MCFFKVDGTGVYVYSIGLLAHGYKFKGFKKEFKKARNSRNCSELLHF